MNAEIATISRVPAEISENGPLVHVLERMMRDPSIPLERIERVMVLMQQIREQEAKARFADAMAAAQTEMRPVAADAANPQTRSRYASYAALDRAIRPTYTKHGFSLSFDTGTAEKPEDVRVLCDVTLGGHTKQYHIDMPADGKGAKGGDVMTKTHATGSAVTYGRRYLLLMIFNIAVGDDDGNAAGGKVINGEQADQLSNAIVAAKADLDKFLALFKIESVADLPAKDYFRALGMVTAKKAKAHGDH